jgi:hypothetical protein
MRKLLVIGALVSALMTLGLAPHAGAYHEAYWCDGNADYYSQNQFRGLKMQTINRSWWYSDHDFIALRFDPSGNETYRQWVPGSSWHTTTTQDGYDRWRRTVIQRAGYSLAYWEMHQYSHGGCS